MGRPGGDRRKSRPLANRVDESTEWVDKSGTSITAWIKTLSKEIKQVWAELLALSLVIGAIGAAVVENAQKINLPIFRWIGAEQAGPGGRDLALKELADRTRADRAFIWAYRIDSAGVSLVFNERWQYNRPELPQINPIVYRIDSPAVQERLAIHQRGKCYRADTEMLADDDWLKTEFDSAFTKLHISCPVILEINGESTLGAVALEFSGATNLDWAEIVLLQFAGGDSAPGGSTITTD